MGLLWHALERSNKASSQQNYGGGELWIFDKEAYETQSSDKELVWTEVNGSLRGCHFPLGSKIPGLVHDIRNTWSE